MLLFPVQNALTELSFSSYLLLLFKQVPGWLAGIIHSHCCYFLSKTEGLVFPLGSSLQIGIPTSPSPHLLLLGALLTWC